MPSWSNSTPVVVGDRIFVCAEPAVLLCVAAKTGLILWQKTHTYLDALPPEEAARARQLLEQVNLDKLVRQLRSAKSRLSRVERKLKDGPEDKSLQEEKATAERQIEKLSAELKPVEHLVTPRPHAVAGFSTPTPVSDGRHVYVFFGNGVAARYDMEGNRSWIRLVEKPKIGYGHSASPLLVDGKLILHINGLVALNAATGNSVWTSEAEPAWGTSVAAKVGDDHLIITPNGECVWAKDGRRTAKGLGRLRFSQPIVHNGIVYFVQNRGKAHRLTGATEGAFKQVWQTRPHSQRRYASPVMHDGIIYTVTEKGILNAIEASTGKVIYERDLEFASKELTYPSMAVAGNYVYASCSNGTTVVIKVGREFKEISRNTLEPFRSCLVFSGRRMYVRTMKHLYCIARP